MKQNLLVIKIDLYEKIFSLLFYNFIIALFFIFYIFQSKKRYLITDYGAKDDSTVINTSAIQKAIDECAANGGGVVVVPKGIFISGAIFLKKNVSLTVEKDGILKGSANQTDYPQIQTRWEGEERLWTSAFINAIGIDDIELNGEGTIDDSWVKNVWLKKNPRRMPRIPNF